MASRHDIVSITFQANAGKANVALQALQTEAKKSSDRVKDLKQQLEAGLRANLPADQIQKIRNDIKQAEREVKQWNNAYKELTKGVRTLDEAVKAFNSGTMGQMSAAFNKAAANAAKLAQSKMTPGTQEWKEMDALIVEAQSNVLKANTAINNLTANIQKGGTASKSTLTQAKTDLQQLLTLETRGSAEWNAYNKQLKVVEGELQKLAQAEQKAAQADQTAMMNKRMKDLKTMSSATLSETKRFWETMVAGAEKGSAELAKYEANLKKVQNEERKRTTANAEGVLGNMPKFGIEQVRQAVQQMTQMRDSVQAGIPAWQHYNKLVKEGEAYLLEYTEREKIARGEAVSLADALKISASAGGMGFKGTATQLQQAEAALQKAAAAAKKGSPEWTRYQEALAKVRVEMQNAGMTSERMRTILAQPTNAKNLNELQAAVKRAKAELDLMAGTVGKNSKEYTNLANQTKKAEIQLKTLQAQSHGTASAFEKAWSRLKTYVGLYVGAAVAMQKIAASMGDLLELSDKMGEVRKTTGMTADEVGRLSDSLAKMDTRRSLVDLMDLASMAGSVGLKSQQDIEGFTKAANQLTVALPEMGNEAARTLIKISNATGDLEKNGGNVEETLQRVGSTIIALRANSASAAGPITDFVSRVGAVGAQAGISIDQIAALGSTIDALGGRVEMSATALSRMIPAIRNNAFGVANAIGVTEKSLTDLFNSGRAMEAMVLIFQKMRESVKQFDTSTEEGQAAMADNVEALLGRNAAMGEVMKELNQQGARAGIVFGLLSQNVDELQKQLGIASDAYSQNTALMNEYNNMNETAAAKWARLKNQLEEFFVSDANQKFLSGIIDFLRKGVDLLTGNGGWSVALRTILLYVSLVRLQLVSIVKGALTSIAGGLKNIGITLGFIKGEMTALQWSNVFTALGAAVLYLFTQLKQAKDALAETRKELGKWAQEILKSEQAVEENFKAVDKANVSIDEANKKLRQAQTALEKARKEMDGSKESAERLKKAEEDLKKAEDDVRKASDAHKASIEQINKLYGSYLGFMLSEISSAKELANARELINAKLRETITLKRKEAALGRIEENLGGDRDEAYGALSQALGSAVRKKVKVGGKEVWTTDQRASTELLREITKRAQGEKLTAKEVEQILSDAGLSIYETTSGGKQKITAYGANLRNLVMNYRREYLGVQKQIKDVETQFDVEASVDREETQRELGEQYTAAVQNYTKLESAYAKATGDARKKAAANLLKQSDTLQDMVKNAQSFYDLTNEDEKKAYDKFIADSQSRIDGIEEQRDKLLKEAGTYYKPVAGSSAANATGGGGSTNPYGNFNRVTSPYEDWNADALVSRRKEMLERVRALANGADVQAVLSEDAKFITEATRKNIKTTRDAIEWYNTERLKIQDALHEKHLTNTGDWMDPKKGGKKASKMVQDEMKYYLDELDAYYTDRKAKIQEAQNDEQISEAEARNRTLANEAEWQQRRGELQQLYSKKRKEVVKDERDAIYAILSDRTGDSTDYIKKDINNTIKFIEKVGTEKGKPAMDRIYGDIDLGMERSFLRQRNAIGQHMKDITAIINKENPYVGITEELRKNLGTMDALLTDIEKDEERTVDKEIERTMFILEQSTKGYALTWEELMREMAKRGWQTWADAVNGDTQTQERLMHQVYRVFEKVQEAIKKEASQLKKDADIMWSNILLPGGDGKTTIKDAFEQTIGALGIEEGRVSRANSLIGAGQASERVADRLAIQQMKVQLAMQQYQYSLVHKIGREKIESLRKEAQEAEAIGDIEKARQARMQAQNAEMALNLATRKEQTEELKQQEAIIAKTEESQARLYTELKSWADLLTSSLQSVFEASNAGNAEYYNELAKLNLTGKGGPGAGTYIVIDNEGTSDATAHYEYLDERAALERQHEIERENAQAEAWKKVMDDINMKMSETITDQLNAMLQNEAIDANTQAVLANTEALYASMGRKVLGSGDMGLGESGVPNALKEPAASEDYTFSSPWVDTGSDGSGWNPETNSWVVQAEASTAAKETILQNQNEIAQGQKQNDTKIAASAQSTFAKMIQAANLYGIAYQAMSNENMSATQKWEMIALQAVGNAAISGLTALMEFAKADAAAKTPGVLGKLWSQLGWAAAPVFAVFTGLLGGLMGIATSKIQKSKSSIAQVTGANNSVASGRLVTGMLTYAEGNVNEFTDPSTLTPGRQYNVDAADGRTYRARYMGANPRTHITNGPEFHLSGERGREMIIDAGTTRQITMNEGEIWHAIQTLSGGGRISATRRRGRGVRAFAEGNLDDFDGSVLGDSVAETSPGMTPDMAASMQASLDANTAVLRRALDEGFRGVFNVYGKDGLVDSYDRGKKTLNRYGERY